ncbi:MAG: hypothetical protein KAT54_08570, partial [Candidatus Marinimicrobia bacterium]|nr:hypothetical protein [Candidatus Neomarinimicrobiota bacterium]
RQYQNQNANLHPVNLPVHPAAVRLTEAHQKTVPVVHPLFAVHQAARVPAVHLPDQVRPVNHPPNPQVNHPKAVAKGANE